MFRLKAVGALAAASLSALALTGCVKPFHHSDWTFEVAAMFGWDHSNTGAALCADYMRAYPGEPCPAALRNGTGPR